MMSLFHLPRRGRPGGGGQHDVRVAFPLLDPPPSDGGGGLT